MTEGEIRKAVVVDAPPEVVFKALTDEKELVRWMTQEARMDPRLGGECEFKYHWAKEDLRSVATGKILELIPNKRLSYTYVLTRSGSGTSGANSLFRDQLGGDLDTRRAARWQDPRYDGSFRHHQGSIRSFRRSLGLLDGSARAPW